MTQDQTDYISLKDFFLIIGDYYRYVKSKWVWICIVGVIVGILLGVKAVFTVPVYKESLTFMMDESEGESLSSLDFLGGLFGKGGKDKNLDKIVQLFESRRIIHDMLFEKIDINGDNDYIANHYLKLYGLEELTKPYKYFGVVGWKIQWPQSLLEDKDFLFTHDSTDDFNPKENQYLRIIFERISGGLRTKPQLVSNLDEDTGIMTLNMESEYENLTLGVLDNIYDQLSRFFIEKSTEKQVKTYRIMKSKRDSVIYAVKSAEYALADFKDGNRNLVTIKGYLRQLQLEREVTILNLMYGEVVKQMEATDFALKNKTPVVQVIDSPRRPIVATITSWKRQFLTGFLLGAILIAFLSVLKKMYSDVMSN